MLPKTKFHKPAGESNIDDAEVKCLVCMMEYEEQEEILTLTCFHKFHGDCI